MIRFQAKILAPRSHDEYSWVFLKLKNDTNENESIYLDWTLRYKDFSFRQERFEWKHLRHKTAKQSCSEDIQRYWIQWKRFFKGRVPSWNSLTASSCAPLCAPTFQSRNLWNDCKSKWNVISGSHGRGRNPYFRYLLYNGVTSSTLELSHRNRNTGFVWPCPFWLHPQIHWYLSF